MAKFERQNVEAAVAEVARRSVYKLGKAHEGMLCGVPLAELWGEALAHGVKLVEMVKHKLRVLGHREPDFTPKESKPEKGKGRKQPNESCGSKRSARTWWVRPQRGKKGSDEAPQVIHGTPVETKKDKEEENRKRGEERRTFRLFVEACKVVASEVIEKVVKPVSAAAVSAAAGCVMASVVEGLAEEVLPLLSGGVGLAASMVVGMSGDSPDKKEVKMSKSEELQALMERCSRPGVKNVDWDNVVLHVTTPEGVVNARPWPWAQRSVILNRAFENVLKRHKEDNPDGLRPDQLCRGWKVEVQGGGINVCLLSLEQAVDHLCPLGTLLNGRPGDHDVREKWLLALGRKEKLHVAGKTDRPSMYLYDADVRDAVIVKHKAPRKSDRGLDDHDIDGRLFDQAMAEELWRPDVCFANPRDGLALVYRPNTKWLGLWKGGMELDATAEKLAKRASVLVRPFMFTRNFAVLSILVLKGKQTAGHRDGAVGVRSSVIDQVIDNHQDSSEKGLKRQEKARKCWAFSGYLMVPKNAGLGSVAAKGYVNRVDDEVMDNKYGRNVDVVTHETNLKEGVGGNEMWSLGLEPSPGGKKARMSLQMMAAMPQLFPEKQLARMVRQTVREAEQKVYAGTALDWMQGMDDGDLISDYAEEEIDSDLMRHRMAAVEMFGKTNLSWQHSPQLTLSVFRGQMERCVVARGKQLKVSLPMPFSYFEQVISSMAARDFGWMPERTEVKKGHMLRLAKQKVHVVHDEDWLANHVEHGEDLDDKSAMFYRRLVNCQGIPDNALCVVVMRSPVDAGEHKVYLVQDEQDCPQEKELVPQEGKLTYAEQEMQVPVLDMEGMRPNLLDALAKKQVKHDPLPKDKEQKGSAYSKEYVYERYLFSRGGANPGGNVDARMVWALHRDGLRARMAGRLEEVIDSHTQSYSQAAVVACQIETMQIWKELFKGSQLPEGDERRVLLDELVWKAKGITPRGCEGEPGLYAGPVTRLVSYARREFELAHHRMACWLAESAMCPPALGNYRASKACFHVLGRVLNEYRVRTAKLFALEAEEKNAKPPTWNQEESQKRFDENDAWLAAQVAGGPGETLRENVIALAKAVWHPSFKVKARDTEGGTLPERTLDGVLLKKGQLAHYLAFLQENREVK